MNIVQRLMRKVRKALRGGHNMRAVELRTPWSFAAMRETATPTPASSESTPCKLDDLRSWHPRPQFARAACAMLDGTWDFSVAPCSETGPSWKGVRPPEVYDAKIRVPFSPEAPLSGVFHRVQPNELMWYGRDVCVPEVLGRPLSPDERCVLHFDAVDYACACFANGSPVVEHKGGYLPFSVDVTNELDERGSVHLDVCVWDPSDKGTQLRGKQHLVHGGIWYTAQSGIWQPVWLEVMPSRHIESIEVLPNADTGFVRVTASVSDCSGSVSVVVKDPDGRVVARVQGVPVVASAHDGSPASAGTPIPAAASAPADSPATAETPAPATAAPAIAVLDFEVERPRLWSPDDPCLYDIAVTFDADEVTSYFAFRTVSVEPDDQGVPRFHLNHQPLFLKGVLDQGYWPDGLMTAPSDKALVHDVQSMRDLGFNMIRKHIKIECDRWYWHCDRLGMLVWQDMVCGGGDVDSLYHARIPTHTPNTWHTFTDDTAAHWEKLSAGDEAYRSEWTRSCVQTVRALGTHPSIVTWVLFNEAWGQFCARDATQAVRELDPTRPIDATSGWYDQGCGDFVSRHEYLKPLYVPAAPEGALTSRASVLTEIGGLSYDVSDHTMFPVSYGYEAYRNLEEYRKAVRAKLDEADALEAQGLAGYVYTQLSDIEEETNGLLTYDRVVNKLG